MSGEPAGAAHYVLDDGSVPLRCSRRLAEEILSLPLYPQFDDEVAAVTPLGRYAAFQADGAGTAA
jgi:hypothetical protein